MTEQEQALHDSYESITRVIDFLPPSDAPASLVLCTVKLALERIQSGIANEDKGWIVLHTYIEELSVGTHHGREINGTRPAVTLRGRADGARSLHCEPQVAAGSTKVGPK